jgi:hypothetical protein
MSSSFTGPVTVDGVPLGGQGIPATFGKTIYVSSDLGSNSYDGLSMTAPKLTLQAAYDLATTDKHDIIVLSGNAAHVLADELVVSKNRVHFIGLDPAPGRYLGQRARITMGLTTGTAVAAIKVTGVGCSFTNLKISSADTLATSLYAVADGGEYTVWTNCHIEKTTDLNETGGADLLCNGDSSLYKHCFIGNNTSIVSVARANILFTRETITGKVARDVVFEDCIITHKTSATTVIHAKATTTDIERMCLFKVCTFWCDVLSSATQALVFGVASALTQGIVLLQDCCVVNVTDTCATAKGVYQNRPAAATTGGEAVLTATT